MARTFDPIRAVQAQVSAIEDESPAAVLSYYVTEFNLPAKVVASSVGLSPLTLYQYVEAVDGVRPSDRTEALMKKACERMHALAASGTLELVGTPKERQEQLAALLAVDETAE